jgi:transcriptional regulator with XRE-family HTH domain
MAKPVKSLNNNRGENETQVLQRFGDNLRKIRESRQLSQEQVAYEAGFSRSYYTEVETGKRNISLLNMVKLCLFLQIELNELIVIKGIKI